MLEHDDTMSLSLQESGFIAIFTSSYKYGFVCFTSYCIPSYDYDMNLLNDQVVFMNDCNGFCQLFHLASPFQDLYAFEGCDAFSEEESRFDSSFASSNTHDHRHDSLRNSSTSFDSPQHLETRDQSSYTQEFRDERSWSWEELMGNENKKSKCTIDSKTRIKWTKELHQRFVDCVDELGGPRKASPKQLLHLMKTKGLTLIHIKSHLQKYRISLQIQEISKGKSERKTNKKELLQPNQNIGKQLMETVRQQLETQSSLNEQLEVQKNLISAIEEQMKQLREILEQRRKPVVLRNEESK